MNIIIIKKCIKIKDKRHLIGSYKSSKFFYKIIKKIYTNNVLSDTIL